MAIWGGHYRRRSFEGLYQTELKSFELGHGLTQDMFQKFDEALATIRFD